MILTTQINGNSHQVFVNQQNAMGLHSKREGGVTYVHSALKLSSVTKEISVVLRKYQLVCSLTTVQRNKIREPQF